jgi:hypothetical protein
MLSLSASALFGREDYRTTVFRELTSDQPTAPRTRAPERDETAVATESEPALLQLGPTMVAPQTRPQAPAHLASSAATPMVRQTSFRGGNSAHRVMGQFPRRAALRPSPKRTTRRQAKPFETAEHEPTISPYLNLDRDENDPQDIPNYLTMVLPQLQQMQMNRTQQREIQQLRGQLQNMAADAGATPSVEMNGATGRVGSARFMDTAQFYGGMRQ